MTSEHDLKPLITRALGAAAATRALAFENPDLQVLATTARQVMEMTPVTPGASVLMSAAWALHLRDKYNMPAVAVTGDLKVVDRWLFRAADALPEFNKAGEVVHLNWRGHCWVEVGGLLCDASIFRTAYGLPPDDVSRLYFESHYGKGTGALMIRFAELPEGLKYRRRAILNGAQMVGLFEKLRYLIEGEQPAAEGS